MKVSHKILLFLVFVALITAAYFRFRFNQNTIDDTERQRIQEILNSQNQEYRSRQQQMLKEFESAIMHVGEEHYQTARNNIEEVADHMTSIKWCAVLCCKLAQDMVNDTQESTTLIQEPLDEYICQYMVKGEQEQWQALAAFMTQLQAADNQYRAGLEQLMPPESFKLPDTGNFGSYSKNLQKIHQQAASMATTTGVTTIGVAVEAVVIKTTFAAFVNAAGKIAPKVGAKIAASIGMSLADGPLPIGDILAIGSLIWVAWDVYDITVNLPREFAENIENLIAERQNEVRADIIEYARKAVKLCTPIENI